MQWKRAKNEQQRFNQANNSSMNTGDNHKTFNNDLSIKRGVEVNQIVDGMPEFCFDLGTSKNEITQML